MTDIDLSPETVLQLAPGIRTRLDAGGHVVLDAPFGTVVDIGPNGFAILALFSQPRTLGGAIERLECEGGGSTDFAPTLSVINMLIEESALVTAEQGARPASGWADPIEHARMLHDDRRTGDYLAAVAAVVRPGDVVLDIGTGSGVLAVAAARAGARRVYAVEASDIAAVAKGVFELNGVQDLVSLVPGWSRQIELPEPADVLVSEVIGNEPFEEEILETTLDARRRLLKPQARLIPHALTLMVRPVLLPEGEMRQRAFGRAAVERWRGLYGIDFQPLLDAADSRPVHTITEAEVVASWPPAGPPVVLGSVDLTSYEEPSLCATADLVVDEPGPVNAIAITFRAHLWAELSHEFDPWKWPTSSWGTSLWVTPEPLEVASGLQVRVHYRRRVNGVPDGLTCQLVAAGTAEEGTSSVVTRSGSPDPDDASARPRLVRSRSASNR